MPKKFRTEGLPGGERSAARMEWGENRPGALVLLWVWGRGGYHPPAAAIWDDFCVGRGFPDAPLVLRWLWGATSSGQSPHRSPRPDGQVSLRSLAPPLPRKALRAFPGPLIARQTTSRPIAILRRKRTGETVQNPFLFPCWKKNGFWNPKKKGLPCGLSGSK